MSGNENNKPTNAEKCHDCDLEELLAQTKSRKIHENLRKSVILFCCMNNLTIKSVMPSGIQDNIQTKKNLITEIKMYEKDPDEYRKKVRENDPTNFVAAELGFLIEVKNESDNTRTEYYHYPVKFTDKGTFNIYDIDNNDDKDQNNSQKTTKKASPKVDKFIVHVTKKKVNSIEDYHGETALFLYCQEKSFQEEMIEKLRDKLSKIEHLKHATLKKIILEIHSQLGMCDDCFIKAQYLFNWKNEQKSDAVKENTKEEQEKPKTFETFLEMLKDCEIPKLTLDKELDKDKELFIIYSYDAEYNMPLTKSHRCFIMLGKNLIDYKMLSNYSIFTSGGLNKLHGNYPRIYDNSVELASKHAVKK